MSKGNKGRGGIGACGGKRRRDGSGRGPATETLTDNLKLKENRG